ncbi:hypothetical protein GRI89_00025, partial [Altererythrobacter salegens]|nr:hypothetical protein [Croceibacterium salegens]
LEISSDEEARAQLVSNGAEAEGPLGGIFAVPQRPSWEGPESGRVESAARPSSVASLDGKIETVSAMVQVDRSPAGELPLQISSDAFVSVRLADLISLFEDRMERPLFVWLKSSTYAKEYVTFDTLKAAGIDVRYDVETRQVSLSIASEAAP